MSYRKTFFGKIIEDDSSKKDDGRNEYIEQKSRSLHFWSGICADNGNGKFLLLYPHLEFTLLVL